VISLKFDKEKFANLIMQAKGNRSLNQYAAASGVTSAHISRLSRQLLDSPPSPQIIRKLAEAAHNDVTYDQLMAAAGHTDPQPYYALTEKDEKDIAKDLERILADLESSEALAFHGEPLDEETKRLFAISLENSLRLAKEMAKKKYTPNKYR